MIINRVCVGINTLPGDSEGQRSRSLSGFHGLVVIVYVENYMHKSDKRSQTMAFHGDVLLFEATGSADWSAVRCGYRVIHTAAAHFLVKLLKRKPHTHLKPSFEFHGSRHQHFLTLLKLTEPHL